jgi:DNA-binding PadR family transcriptional regulator
MGNSIPERSSGGQRFNRMRGPRRTPLYKRILQNPPDELPLEELQRITKRGGGIRIENKQQRRSRERQEKLRAEKRRMKRNEDLVVFALLRRTRPQWAGSIVKALRLRKVLPEGVDDNAIGQAARRLVTRGEVRIVEALSKFGGMGCQYEITDHGRLVYFGLARRRPAKAVQRSSQCVANGYRAERLLLSALVSGPGRGARGMAMEVLKDETLMAHSSVHYTLERMGKAGWVRKEKAEIDTSKAIPLCARPKFVYRVLPAGRARLAELLADQERQRDQDGDHAGQQTMSGEVSGVAGQAETGNDD